jgi:hypothetical protein
MASGLTGMPAFAATTVRFNARPTAISGAAGTHRFTPRNTSRSP